jgi:ribosome-interacting GTPase 1
MPTNLPPEYYEVEDQYRAAQTTEEKIRLLEELISTIPKHKGTDKLRAGFRRRLSKLKTSAQSKKKSSRVTSVYQIDKEGAGQVVVIGAANTGKSSLIAELTNASPEISKYPFTTWQPTPGMMQVEDLQIQLIDTPPIDREFVEPDFLQLVRRADLIVIIVDLLADPMAQLDKSIELLEKNKIIPEHLKKEPSGRRFKYTPVIVLANKNDDEQTDENFEIFCEFIDAGWKLLPISLKTERNLYKFKQMVFEDLKVIRVYSKAPGKDPDMDKPFVLEEGATVEDFSLKVHKDFYDKLKSARVWGGADFEGQLVSREYILSDGDVVELKI